MIHDCRSSSTRSPGPENDQSGEEGVMSVRFVHSMDLRDDPATFYLVVETDVETESGLCCGIVLPEAPDHVFYRPSSLLVDANAEVAGLEDAATQAANRLRRWA